MKPRLPYGAFRLASARLELMNQRSTLTRVFHAEKAGPARIDLLLIARRTRAVAGAVESLCDSFVTANIRRHEKLLEKARKSLASTGPGLDSRGKSFEELLARVEETALLFRDLDRRGPRVRSRMAWALSRITGMEQEQKKALFKEKAYRAELLKKQREAAQVAQGGENIRAEALRARIMLCEKRIAMLTEFAYAFVAVRPAMNRAAAEVDHFLRIVRENRRVFEEAAATLAMKRDFDAALFDLSPGPAFSEVASGMQKSFAELADAERLLLAKAREGA